MFKRGDRKRWNFLPAAHFLYAFRLTEQIVYFITGPLPQVGLYREAVERRFG